MVRGSFGLGLLHADKKSKMVNFGVTKLYCKEVHGFIL